MMFSVLFFILFGFLLGTKADDDNGDVPLHAFAESLQTFSGRSYAILANASGQDSIVFCPFSAQMVLALTAEGARYQTLTQLVKALHLPEKPLLHAALDQIEFSITTDDLKLISANKLYIADSFAVQQNFLDIAEVEYDAEIQNVNFSDNEETADMINNWVEQQTNNKIKNLIDPGSLSDSTTLVLVNTLYLNASWTIPFLERKTSNGTFYLLNGSKKTVQMMNSDTTGSSSYKYLNSSQLNACFLQLDFKESNLSMTFILPNIKRGLKKIENNLEDYLEPQNYTIQRVAVVLPKFEVTSPSMDLKSPLEQLGVKDLFSRSNSNLLGISYQRGLYVNTVVQKSFLNVTENGVEAAAATAVVVDTRHTAELPPPTLSFIANRSFVYHISDRISGIVYFVGRLTTI